MKKTELMVKAGRTLSKAGLKIKKYSPEILIISGVAGVVVSTVMACRATTKIGEVVDDTKETVKNIHESNVVSEGDALVPYTDDRKKKDLVMTYTQTGVKLVKIYAPSVILGVLSITSILASNNILRKRNAAIAAAYAAVDGSFKAYRKRVKERFGEDVEREIMVGSSFDSKKDAGDTKDKKKRLDLSPHARIFDETNLNWQRKPDYNLMFLKQQEQWANDKLRAQGFLFLNDVYESLGFCKTSSGQLVGWIYDPDDPERDGFIDFGLYRSDQKAHDFINADEPSIILDFNVDGIIYDLI